MLGLEEELVDELVDGTGGDRPREALSRIDSDKSKNRTYASR